MHHAHIRPTVCNPVVGIQLGVYSSGRTMKGELRGPAQQPTKAGTLLMLGIDAR